MGVVSEVKAQIFSASGGKVGIEFLVNTITTDRQERPSIAALTNGGFVITWQDRSGQGGDLDGGAKAQIYTSSGAKVGGEFLINTVTAGFQSPSSITALANGGFVVTWEDFSGQGGDASSTSIKAQVFNAAGVKVGGELLVNTITFSSRFFPSIAALPNGDFVVT